MSSILDRLWCRLCQKCPVPEPDYADDERRIDHAQHVISRAMHDLDIRLHRDSALSERRRENDPPQGRNG